MKTPDWESALFKDERILWQGRPDASVHFGAKHFPPVLIGIILVGVGLYFLIMPSPSGKDMGMVSLAILLAGLCLGFGPILWDTYKRRRSWYMLSDKRAFIVVDTPIGGRKSNSYPINKRTDIEYMQGPLSTLIFHSEVTEGDASGRFTIKIGFEYIADGDEVHTYMQILKKADR